jgi:hypothetical protein
METKKNLSNNDYNEWQWGEASWSNMVGNAKYK